MEDNADTFILTMSPSDPPPPKSLQNYHHYQQKSVPPKKTTPIKPQPYLSGLCARLCVSIWWLFHITTILLLALGLHMLSDLVYFWSHDVEMLFYIIFIGRQLNHVHQTLLGFQEVSLLHIHHTQVVICLHVLWIHPDYS